MTLNEFKAWLEGFEEAIDGAPTEAQWKKLKDKLATLEPDRPAYAPPSTTWTAWNKTGVPYSLTQ